MYKFTASGRIYASVVNASTGYDAIKIEDTARGKIEDKVKQAVDAIEAQALRRRVEKELRAEREIIRQKSKDWEDAKRHKDELLAQLANFDSMATALERAQRLRRLIAEIVASSSVPPELATSVDLLHQMADWLDPLVKKPWPEVDGIAERNPYGSW